MDTIEFNSQRSSPTGFCELSNFYGGVEFEYMAQRFNQSEVARLFDHLEVCDNQEFWRWLQILNPKGSKKKPVTQKQMDYWFTKGGIANGKPTRPKDGSIADGKPIRGIAAQMLGTMVRDTKTAKDRRKRVMKELGITSINDNEELSDDDKQRWMKACLRHKYADTHFRKLLLSTGVSQLHEIPLRGNGAKNNWTHKVIGKTVYGKGWLGRLLMEIRDEIRDDIAAAEPASKRQRTAVYKQFCV
jgi:hypothetical protein